MRVAEFDYALPPERIAQVPSAERDGSRLMVLDRGGGTIEHRRFRDLPELLRAGDVVMVNDTRVRHARLSGAKTTGARVEVLMLEPRSEDPGATEWMALVRSSGRLRPGAHVTIEDRLSVELLRRVGDAWIVRVEAGKGGIEAAVERCGVMPLPPYIRRDAEDPREPLDRERYQTIFAARGGSVAAPTAGLHFTPRLVEALRARGIAHAALTLDVGIGTFQPVRCEKVEQHRMHAERFRIPESARDAVADARGRGGRVVAVGTTVARTLESMAAGQGRVRAGSGRCDLFIYPGHRFEVIDALITNFHLPRSTLLMLVGAFAGRERVLEAYREAIAERYRFYSYGDAMLIL